jgi:hypothetical protein
MKRENRRHVLEGDIMVRRRGPTMRAATPKICAFPRALFLFILKNRLPPQIEGPAKLARANLAIRLKGRSSRLMPGQRLRGSGIAPGAIISGQSRAATVTRTASPGK